MKSKGMDKVINELEKLNDRMQELNSKIFDGKTEEEKETIKEEINRCKKGDTYDFKDSTIISPEFQKEIIYIDKEIIRLGDKFVREHDKSDKALQKSLDKTQKYYEKIEDLNE